MSERYCGGEQRRQAVRNAPLYGLDFVEVGEDGRTLDVFFLGKAPKDVKTANVQISGGRRIRDVRAVSVRVHRQPDPTLDDRLEVRVNKTGDFSDYTLRLVKLDEAGRPTAEPMDGFDPAYSAVFFNFKAGCPSELDCKPQQQCLPAEPTRPEINYLAKDYDSFRQLILDRLALTMPDWKERHTPDIGIMLVEVLAYAADYLSYYQDAVATEAYLDTARQRVSVRRHVRLVDYRMHEGCDARAWVAVETDSDATLDARQIFFTTVVPGYPETRMLQNAQLRLVPRDSYEVFEPLVADPAQPLAIFKAHSEMRFYTWGDSECCLPQGATSATLVDHWMDSEDGTRRALQLNAGDVLIFEEASGPVTGNSADADPSHRQAVKLTRVTRSTDPLYRQPVVEIEWCAEDALMFPLCISAKMPAPDCSVRNDISVARGNVILVDHGATVYEDPLATVPADQTVETCACECNPASATRIPAKVCPALQSRPLTFAEPLPGCACAATILVQDARRAMPQVWLTGTEATPDGDVVTEWKAVPDLLNSPATDAAFVVEMDDDGIAHLRFGEGELGMMPAAGTVFGAKYRVGNGPAGNVGAEAITTVVFREPTGNAGKLKPRNPLAAVGGTRPEPVEEVKMFAPYAFRNVLERAITAEDYSALAADNARRMAARGPDRCASPFRKLQGAKARLRWTGGWYQVLVALDPLGKPEADPALISEVAGYLERYRRLGHDLSVQQAQTVGLDLALRVCVDEGFLRGHVRAALLDVFSARGFFHPDNLTFGEGIFASRIIAAAQALTGVKDVTLIRLQRYEIGTPPPGSEPAPGETPAGGMLPLGPFEIARLDNDPGFPENGRLTLDLRGGR